jgi:hypothetical protein
MQRKLLKLAKKRKEPHTDPDRKYRDLTSNDK